METERVLLQIGLPVKPRAVLVGFATSDSAAWPICVEPEYRFFQPAHLDGAVERAREIYENDHPMRYRDQNLLKLRQELDARGGEQRSAPSWFA